MSEQLLKQVITLAKSGESAKAIQVLKQYIRQNPTDARGWWAMAKLAPSDKIKIESLKRVLKLKPGHAQAQHMLTELEKPPKPDGPEWLTAQIETPVVDDKTPSDAEEELEDDAFPPMQLFGLSESPPTASDETSDAERQIIQNVLRRKQQQREAAANQKKEISTRTWIMLGAGIFSVVLVLVLVVVYLQFFRDNDPDLNTTVQSAYASMEYPDEWKTTITDSNMIVVSTELEDITTHNIDPWSDLNDLENREYGLYLYYKLEYWEKYNGTYDWMFADDGDMGEEMAAMMGDMLGDMIFPGFGSEQTEMEEDDMIVVVLQPIPGRSDRDFTAAYLVEYIVELLEEDLSYWGDEITVGSEDITIDNEPAKFFKIIRENEYSGLFEDDEDADYSTLYFAVVSHGDVDHLFLFSTLEPEAGRWEELAKEMAQSIQFSGG